MREVIDERRRVLRAHDLELHQREAGFVRRDELRVVEGFWQTPHPAPPHPAG